MNKPLLVVITGRPASGKTTLSRIISQEIHYPLLSRDELKEGYISTLNTQHNQLDNSADIHVYNTFFEVIDLLISKGISIIVEAAFQNKLWKPKLLSLLNKAKIKIIICNIPLELAKQRFGNRLINEPEREKFHGDNSFDLKKTENVLFTEAYELLAMNLPTLEVDTSEDYRPNIQSITGFIKQ